MVGNYQILLGLPEPVQPGGWNIPIGLGSSGNNDTYSLNNGKTKEYIKQGGLSITKVESVDITLPNGSVKSFYSVSGMCGGYGTYFTMCNTLFEK